ncbi:MAG: hypothetical protein KH135_05825 [Firmicutes bacterium]|nr:hypothetical protein [Bacillota bacterium]
MKDSIKDFIATFLAIILCFLAVGFICIKEAEQAFDKKTIQTVVKNTDLTSDVKEREETSQIKNAFGEVYTAAEQYHIPSEFVDDVLNDEITKDFFGRVAANVTESVITGENKEIVSQQEFNELIKNNMDHFVEKSKLELSQEQKDKFVSLATNHSETILNLLPTTESLKTHINTETLDMIQLTSNGTLKIIILMGIIVCIIGIVFTKWKNRDFLSYLATPLLFASIILILISQMIPTLVTMLIPANNDLLYLFIDQLALHMKDNILIFGGIIGISSILIYILIFVLKKVIKKKDFA